ncbi:hypothetical protein E4U03_10980 [Rothia nasimurium]|uniref:Phage tail tape measure protein n=1 Tax=Rothia nasimurium TaxID=85336 RepID=A0A4Y9F3A3_9MICC|nr:hypothetical protein [Rothia nasimurium]MBF0809122.1 hypothetical protein [Rothia nasimurium]TFU20644.1 hypothetical protein E4U03_10980 [Rothia nasimurium]
MAGKSAVFSLRVVADAKQASGELSKLERAVQGVESTVDKMTPAASVAGAALLGFGTYAGQAAAEAEQNFGAVDTVFKEAADTVHGFAAEAAQAVGMSSSSYESLAASIGGSLSKAGYSQDELAAKTNDLINAGADLSSVFGGDAAEASEAMGAALRGEFDSLERFGVFMSAAAVEARMAAEGTSELEGAAFEAAKKQATVNEIMEQAGAYQGNFAREADTAAGAQQRATAEFQNAAASLGSLLLPVMTEGANKLAGFARWAQENQDKVAALAVGIGAFSAVVFAAKGAIMAFRAAMAIQAVVQGVTVAFSAYSAGLSAATAASAAGAGATGAFAGALGVKAAQVWANVTAAASYSASLVAVGARMALATASTWAYNAAQFAIRAATATWTAAQWALNAALNANPIGLIVIAIAALVAAFIWAYENVEWFRDGVDAALTWIKAAWNTASQWIGDTWNAAIQWVKDTWNAGVAWIVSKYTALVDGAREKADFIKEAFTAGVDVIKGKFEEFGDKVRAIFEKIGNWAKGIKDKVTGLFDGFKMPSMPDWAKKLMGGGTEAYGYELGHDGVFYAPARGVALEPPFALTAATEAMAPVTLPRTAAATKIIHKTYEVTFNMNGVIGDERAIVQRIKQAFENDRILQGN